MQSEVSDRINLGHSEIYLTTDGIVVVKGTDHTYTTEDIKQLHSAISKLTNNKKCLVLLLGSRYTLVDSEARDFLSTPAASSNFIANAYVIESLAHRMILNFIIRVKGTPIPSKFFFDEASAVKWLKSFRGNE